IVTDELPQIGVTVEAWGEHLGGWPPLGRRAAVVTDENVVSHAQTVLRSLSAHGWQVRLIKVPPGEPSKSQAVISRMYDELVDMQADRRTLIVAVGGGVVGDAAGFL